MIIIFRDFSEKPTNFDENSIYFYKIPVTLLPIDSK
jgi:hypothetical protein